jgi:hypothetical protein
MRSLVTTYAKVVAIDVADRKVNAKSVVNEENKKSHAQACAAASTKRVASQRPGKR